VSITVENEDHVKWSKRGVSTQVRSNGMFLKNSFGKFEFWPFCSAPLSLKVTLTATSAGDSWALPPNYVKMEKRTYFDHAMRRIMRNLVLHLRLHH